MNRRQFLTSTALALPSVTLLGAVLTQPTKTYKKPNSLLSTEELNGWCQQRGVYYDDNELTGNFEYVFSNWSHTNNYHNLTLLLNQWVDDTIIWGNNDFVKVKLVDVVSSQYRGEYAIAIKYDLYSNGTRFAKYAFAGQSIF